jgi:ABC-type multidrug transport system ATPase subunit
MRVSPGEPGAATIGGDDDEEMPTGALLAAAAAESATTSSKFRLEAENFAFQTAALSYKSYLSLWRSPLWALVYIALPLLCALALAGVSDAINNQVYPPEGGVALELTKCNVFNVYGRVDDYRSCTTVAWAPAADPVAASAMARLAATHGFRAGDTLGRDDVASFATAEDLAQAMLRSPGAVDGAVVFTNTSGLEVAYELFYNRTALFAYAKLKRDPVGGYFKVAGRSLALQLAVDAAIVAELAPNSGDRMSADLALVIDSLPQKLSGSFLHLLNAPNVVPWLGPTFSNIGFAAQTLMVASRLVGEKESGVIFTLRRMGLMEAAHWLSWFLVLALPNFASAALLAVVAPLVTNVNLFTHASPAVLLLLWGLTSCSHTALACCLAAATPARYLEHVSAMVSMLVVGFTFVLSSFSLYIPMWGNWQMERQPGFSPLGSAVFFTWPFFHFSRALDLILEVTKTTGDDNAQRFEWRDLRNRGERRAYDTSNIAKIKYFEPEGVDFALWMLVLSSLMYFVLAWYAGQLFSGEGGGPSKHFWFPVLPSYWGYGWHNVVVFEGDVAARERWLSERHASVNVHKLSVSYGKVQALRETTFSFAPGQIWALLGHNGAGKSTLINVLSGLVPPTFGHAFVRGMDVREEIASLQRHMGTCPQHDTLFSSLTGREHLMVYCAFKGLRGAAAAAEVFERLSDVDLLSSADVLAANYSGGMKRRLSVAMAAIGDPKILIYDEPSTGMDPVVRRKIWASIAKLKAGRLVVLTTHSMEEADVLGDSIAVLHEGKLRALGTSLELKAKYGRGYELSMLVPAGREASLAAAVKQDLPGAELHMSAGNLKTTLPRSALRHLPHFFANLKTQKGLGDLDWGVSNSTLEEVFLRLVASGRGLDKGLEDGQNFVDIDPEMVAFALETWAPLVQNKLSAAELSKGKGKSESGGSITGSGTNKAGGGDSDTAWLLQGSQFLKGPVGRELEPAVWRPPPSALEKAAASEKHKAVLEPTALAEGNAPSGAHMCKVVIPPGAPPGSLLQVEVSLPTGKSTVHITVPPSTKAGQAIMVAVTPPPGAFAVSPAADTPVEAGGPVDPAIQSLADVPARASASSQVDGILRKSLALQSTRCCFNWCSCCCVCFAVLLTWLFGLIQPAAVPVSGSNCSTFSFTVAAPHSLCNEQAIVQWAAAVCPATSGATKALDQTSNRAFGLQAGQATAPGVAYFPDSQWFTEGEVNYEQFFLRRQQAGFDESQVSSLVYFQHRDLGGPWAASACCPSDALMLADESGGAIDHFYCWSVNSTNGYTNSLFEPDSDAAWLITAASVPYPHVNSDRNWSTFWSWVDDEVATALAQPSALRRMPASLRTLAKYAVQQQAYVLSVDDDAPYTSTAGLFVVGSASAEVSARFPVSPDASAGAVFSETQKLQFRDSVASAYSASRDARPVNTSMWWSDASGGTAFSTYPGVAGFAVADVRTAVRESQDAMASRMVDEVPFGVAQSLAPVTCAGIAAYAWKPQDDKWPEKRGVVENTDPAKLFSQSFPNFGLEISKSSPALLQFHATVLFYGFGWASTAWPYARVFSEQPCADGTVDECCDVFEIASPRDWPTAWENEAMFACKSVDWFGNVPFGREPALDLRLPSAVGMVSNALLRAATGGQGSIKTTLVAMPALCFTPALAAEAIGWQLFLVPFIVSFLFPPFAVMLTAEKSMRLYHGMTVKGMTTKLYWFANWVYGMALFGALGLLYAGLAQLMQIKSFLNCGWGLLILVTVCWAHAQTMLAFLFSGVANEPKSTAITAYLILFVTAIAGGVINSPEQVFEPYPWQLLIFPNFAYSRALSLCLLYGGDALSTDLTNAVLWLCGVSTGLGAFGAWAHHAKSSASPPCDCLLPSVALALGGACGAWTQGQPAGSAAATGSTAGDVEMRGLGGGLKDALVETAAEDVRSGRAARNPRTCVLLENFTRTYPSRGGAPPKTAVWGVNLAIEYGETFGLLGPNGAGKTTLLETLSGLAVAQTGRALVGGADLSLDLKRALGLLGVCPQFDVVWPELTVADHLLLYARLKGIPAPQQRAAATLAATKVGLDGDAFLQKSRELSGGMRRRLSIAAALVGEPKVLILDEPTTGLDPDTRRKIWDIIAAEKRPTRAIIITTHSMEEADTLCSRVGIMAAGQLRALGTPQRLKSTYGTGFKLEVTLARPGADVHARTLAFVRSFVRADRRSDVTFHRQGATRAVFSLPRGAFDAAEALAALQARASEHGVSEWSLAQPSLEEVFVNIANRYTRD